MNTLRAPACNPRAVDSHCTPTRRTASVVVHSASTNGVPVTAVVDKPTGKGKGPKLNIIPNNGVWANGIPPVMGAHLMASGTVAPISVSKGAGQDVAVHQFQYPNGEVDASIVLHATPAAAAATVARVVIEASEAAIKAKGSFTLVISGGSLPGQLSALAASKGVKWDKFHIFWVDERNVPHDHPDSNFKGATDAFLSKVPIPASQIYGIQENLPVKQAAVAYEGKLLSLPASILPRTEDNFPIFDCTLLGIGPDGHCASLFPNHPQLSPTTSWVLPVDNSPKPPPERITFSLPVINNSKDVIFVALGESKAEIVQRILEVQALPGSLPSQLVRPKSGKLRWILDVTSAQLLDIASWDNTKKFPRST